MPALALALLLAAPADSPPNLLVIVTDDQGPWAAGFAGRSSLATGEIVTPNLDRLAASGAVLTNAFVTCPVCSPSRATWLTGRYPTELGITDWISPQQAAAGLGLPDVPTWPALLRDDGYRTGLFGKWHLGERPGFHPTARGFGTFFGFLGGGTRPIGPTLQRITPGEVGEPTKYPGEATPDLITDAALEFLRADGGVPPFLACVHFRAPHTPYAPVPAVDSAAVADLDLTVPRKPGADVKRLTTRTREYYASIHSVDRNVGRLLDELETLGVANDTVVLFTSDHGYNLGHHGIETKGNGHWIAGGIRGPKRPNMWDTSIRIPTCVRWSGVIEPGTRSDGTFTNLDACRTFCGIAGVDVPGGVRGTDLSAVWRGNAEPDSVPDVVFGQYDLMNGGLAYLRMVRTPTHKLVRHFRSNQMDELYDLAADPGENRNLLGRRAAAGLRPVVGELDDRLTAWMRSIDDPVLGEVRPGRVEVPVR